MTNCGAVDLCTFLVILANYYYLLSTIAWYFLCCFTIRLYFCRSYYIDNIHVGNCFMALFGKETISEWWLILFHFPSVNDTTDQPNSCIELSKHSLTRLCLKSLDIYVSNLLFWSSPITETRNCRVSWQVTNNVCLI